MGSRRMLIIGWDGAEPSLVLPWLGQGRLPYLAALVANGGIAQPIRSTIRPESSVAWTTLATGADPGMHGVFGFMRFVPHSYHTRLVSSNDVALPFFWEVLSQAGYRVGILNMPMAYPPRPVRGWLVSGLMAPGTRDRPFTYPPELSTQLIQRGYVIDADPPLWEEEKPEVYARRMIRQIVERARLAAELLTETSWDFGMVVFTELDRLQHFFWRSPTPNGDGEPSRVVLEGYQALDTALGVLRSVTAPHTTIAIVSDHGFGSCDYFFYVNAWLAAEGLLRFKRNPLARTPLDAALGLMRRAQVVRHLKRHWLGRRGVLAARAKQAFVEAIDWANTQAWYADVGGIRLNVQGREPMGIVSPSARRTLAAHIAARLALVRHAGQPVIQQVHLAEELYRGPFVDRAPDLILEPARLAGSRHNYWIASHHAEDPSRLFAPCAPYTGDHLPEGIFVASAVPERPIHDLSEVASWILQCFGIEQGGRQGSDIIQRPPERRNSDVQDEARMTERLRRLGYLS